MANTLPDTSLVVESAPLPVGPWPAVDPFMFVMHHVDHYPRGNARLGPDASLDGREMGNDFAGHDGWNMYHGTEVPGFPAHPHRGFETVTVVRRGLVDHSDSMGATARYGAGDVQWLTAGRGIVHSEMFPVVHPDEDNPLELFQIWLNLPARSKMATPHFSMMWDENVRRVAVGAPGGPSGEVTVVAGRFRGIDPAAPPPDSWASDPASDVAIWVIDIDEGATVDLPPANSAEVHRLLYVHGGGSLEVADATGTAADVELVDCVAAVEAQRGITLRAQTAVSVLVLQGRPIGEPVARYGPFVMNTDEEIHQAFADYRSTGFGGWPWSVDGPHHGSDSGRFAVHPDGALDEPPHS